MRKIITLLIISFCISCGKTKKNERSIYASNLVDLVIDQKSNSQIEFKNLYDSLTSKIPEDSSEIIQLVQILKNKGFQITNYGKGNFLYGPRVVIATLKKDECECEVAKYYYKTFNDSFYLRTESISCK